MTFPSPLYWPRTMRTSSFLRIGNERTLYFARSSEDNGDDIIIRRTDDGAEKCALRDLRRDEDTASERFIVLDGRTGRQGRGMDSRWLIAARMLSRDEEMDCRTKSAAFLARRPASKSARLGDGMGWGCAPDGDLVRVATVSTELGLCVMRG